MLFTSVEPSGRNLSPEQALKIDDEFFRSDPLAHFSSKISLLLQGLEHREAASSSAQAEFISALGMDTSDSYLDFSERERELQIAIDALMLRHHAAEALLRLLYAKVAATPESESAPCLWVAIAESPVSMKDVIGDTHSILNEDASRLKELFFPEDTPEQQLLPALETVLAWLNFAIDLFLEDHLNINDVYNKVKHGLATSARDDTRVELMTALEVKDGTVPLDSFGEGRSLPIFDRPVLTAIRRPRGKPRQGLEAISVRVDVPVILAEVRILASIYAAVFHLAAKEHFQGRTEPDVLAPYPTMFVGRFPSQLSAGQVGGFRSPITLPPDDKTPPRAGGLVVGGRFLGMRLDLESRVDAVVVDGEPSNA